MKLAKLVFIAVIAVASSSVFAEGGAERSQQYLAAFKLSQQQVHGTSSTVDVQSTANADSQDEGKQGKNSEG